MRVEVGLNAEVISPLTPMEAGFEGGREVRYRTYSSEELRILPRGTHSVSSLQPCCNLDLTSCSSPLSVLQDASYSNQCNAPLDKDESRDWGAGSTWRKGYAGNGTTDVASSVSLVQGNIERW